MHEDGGGSCSWTWPEVVAQPLIPVHKVPLMLGLAALGSLLSQPAATHTEGKKYLQAFFKNDRLGKANCQKSS